MMTAQSTPWTEERILDAMHRSRKFVEHAILALYREQSPEQQKTEDTDEKRDRKGFNRFDKPFLNDMAGNILESQEPEGHRLSDRQLYYSLVKLRKYSQQLADLANARTAAERRVDLYRRTVESIGRNCDVCGNQRTITTEFLGVPIDEPCPRCGETPFIK